MDSAISLERPKMHNKSLQAVGHDTDNMVREVIKHGSGIGINHA